MMSLFFMTAKEEDFAKNGNRYNELCNRLKTEELTEEQYCSICDEIDRITPWKDDLFLTDMYFVESFFGIGNEEKMVEEKDVLKLIDYCNQILADHSKAPYLLPPSRDLYGIALDYGESYYKDVEDVRDTFQNFMKDTHNMENLRMKVWSVY